MSFDAHDRALDLLRTLSPLLAPLTACDASLADQLRRAAASTLLNIAEANRAPCVIAAIATASRSAPLPKSARASKSRSPSATSAPRNSPRRSSSPIASAR